MDGEAVKGDQKSESGSEHNWDAQPPAGMSGQDVFSLAAAAGRDGEAFEERAAAWRSRGEVPGGRRDTTRRGSQVRSLRSGPH